MLRHYVDDSVSVDEPHHSGLGVASHTAAEPGAASLLGLNSLGLGHEARLELLLLVLQELWGSLPAGFHLADLLDGHYALR